MMRKFPDEEIERDVLGNTLTVQSIILQRYVGIKEKKKIRRLKTDKDFGIGADFSILRDMLDEIKISSTMF